MSNTDDFYLDNNGSQLSQYNGPGGEVVVPDGVKEVCYGAFHRCEKLTSVVLPEGVTDIGGHAFSECPNLRLVVLPSSVRTIGDSAFAKCAQLESCGLPEGLECLDDSAFEDCAALRGVKLPQGLTSLGSDVFRNCTGLTDAYGLLILNGVLFHYLGKGGSVTVPEGVTEIRADAFREGGTEVPSNQRCGWEYKCFREKGSLRSVTLPSTLRVIGACAFRGCSGLQRLELPKTLEEIGELAFFDCSALKDITAAEGNPVFETIDGVLFCRREKKLLCYPAGKKNKCYSVPVGTEAIASNAFSFTRALEEIRIPNAVHLFEDRAFMGPPPLKSRFTTCDMFFRSIWIEPGGQEKQVGTDVFNFRDGKTLAHSVQDDVGPLCYPGLPISFLPEKAIRIRLALGFCENPALFGEPYRSGYEAFAKNNEKTLLKKAESLKLDAVKSCFSANGTDYSKLTEQTKVELLEAAICERNTDEVRRLLQTIPSFEFVARAIGYACIYGGSEILNLLIDNGFHFSYHPDTNLRKKYAVSVKTASYTYDADYSLLAVYRGADPYIDVLFGGERKLHFAELSISTKNMLPDEERLACVRILYEREVKGISFQNLLYYSILWGCRPVEDYLLQQELTLPGWAVQTLAESFTSPKRGEFLTLVADGDPAVTAHSLDRFAELLLPLEKKPVLTMLQFDVKRKNTFYTGGRSTNAWDDRVLSRVVTLTDTSKLSKTALMKGAVEHDCCTALVAMADAGWYSKPAVRDELITLAQEKRHTEALAWLLDYKNRTADLAAEAAAREKKERKSLNANPNSVSELKKIWLYAVDEQGWATIRSYKGEEIDVTVPEKIGKATVTAIGEDAFAYHEYNFNHVKNNEVRKKLRSVTLPDTVTQIGKGAFSYCEALKTVRLPEGLTEIGDGAFAGCKKLSLNKLPDGLKSVGKNAFGGCSDLKGLRFPSGKVRYGDRAFFGCKRLRDEQGFLIVDGILMDFDDSITEVIVPDTVREIQGGLFGGSSCKVEKLVIPESVQKLGDGICYNNESLEELVLPDGLEEIPASAFNSCEKLRKIKLPRNLRRIRKNAFDYCPLPVIQVSETVMIEDWIGWRSAKDSAGFHLGPWVEIVDLEN